MDETTAPRLIDLTVAEFTDILASEQPLPGGGSAAALTGALGAALAAMVARLTTGRARYAGHDAEMRKIRDAADGLRARLLAMVDADPRAYQEVMIAYQMPRETESQRAYRIQAIQAALRGAAEAPLEAAGLCLEVLELTAAVAAHGNRNAAGDTAVGALLAHAGLRGAAHNVRLNLALMHDAHYGDQTRRRVDELEAAGELALARALAAADAAARGA